MNIHTTNGDDGRGQGAPHNGRTCTLGNTTTPKMSDFTTESQTSNSKAKIS